MSVEDGLPVLQFTTAEGTPVSMAVDPVTYLPAWTRRVVPHANLGDVAVTAYFTGYVPQDGVMLPYGLMNRIDWRSQVTLMFQVDSYRLNLAPDQMPALPGCAGARGASSRACGHRHAAGEGCLGRARRQQQRRSRHRVRRSPGDVRGQRQRRGHAGAYRRRQQARRGQDR